MSELVVKYSVVPEGRALVVAETLMIILVIQMRNVKLGGMRILPANQEHILLLCANHKYLPIKVVSGFTGHDFE